MPAKANASKSLIAAVVAKNIAAVRAALLAGANVNARDPQDRYPLEIALFAGKYDIAELLVSSGADADCVTEVGTLLLGLCNCEGEKMLKADIKIALWLLEHGASATRARTDGGTPLMYAARARDSHDVIDAMIAHGAKATADKAGDTPLHWAVDIGDPWVMERLLALGNPLDAKNQAGETPLTTAQREGSTKAVAFLLERGAKRDVVVDGQTPLERAIAAKQSRIVKLLGP